VTWQGRDVDNDGGWEPVTYRLSRVFVAKAEDIALQYAEQLHGEGDGLEEATVEVRDLAGKVTRWTVTAMPSIEFSAREVPQ
jgi:hypothetical protein